VLLIQATQILMYIQRICFFQVRLRRRSMCNWFLEVHFVHCVNANTEL